MAGFSNLHAAMPLSVMRPLHIQTDVVEWKGMITIHKNDIVTFVMDVWSLMTLTVSHSACKNEQYLVASRALRITNKQVRNNSHQSIPSTRCALACNGRDSISAVALPQRFLLIHPLIFRLSRLDPSFLLIGAFAYVALENWNVYVLLVFSMTFIINTVKLQSFCNLRVCSTVKTCCSW